MGSPPTDNSNLRCYATYIYVINCLLYLFLARANDKVLGISILVLVGIICIEQLVWDSCLNELSLSF